MVIVVVSLWELFELVQYVRATLKPRGAIVLVCYSGNIHSPKLYLV